HQRAPGAGPDDTHRSRWLHGHWGLREPGPRDTYTFTVTENSRPYFDALTNNGDVYYSLTGPRGQVIAQRSFTANSSFLSDLPPGEYRLTLDASGDSMAAYSFRLLNVLAGT